MSYFSSRKEHVCWSSGILYFIHISASYSSRGTITTKVLPEGSYHGETGFLANTESYRGSTRFSTPMMKALLSDQVGSDPGPISLKKQTTERSFHNASFTSKPASAGNDSESTSDGEYLQSHTFITQTYADLRYITRTVWKLIALFVTLVDLQHSNSFTAKI